MDFNQFIQAVWEAMDVGTNFIVIVLGFAISIVLRYHRRRRTKKSVDKNRIKFHLIQNIKPIAHGEPFWKHEDKGLVIEQNANGKDKSEGNIYVVEKISSERIGKNEYPAQKILLKKISGAEKTESNRKLGVKALVLSDEGEYFNALVSENNRRLDATFQVAVEPRDFGEGDVLFNCVRRGWDMAFINDKDGTAAPGDHDLELANKDVKYGDIFADDGTYWITAFIICQSAGKLQRLYKFAGTKPVILSMCNNNMADGDQLTLQKIFSENPDYELTESGNYLMLMTYARIINKTILE